MLCKIKPFLIAIFSFIACHSADAQEMTGKEKRTLIKSIRRGEANVQRKDSIVFVDKVREVEVIREVPKIVIQEKQVLRDTCIKSRQEVRLDFKQAKDESDRLIKLAKIEQEGKIRLMKLELEKIVSENKALQDSLKKVIKLRRVEGSVAKDTVRQDRKADIVESKSKVKVARSETNWIWGIVIIVLILGFLAFLFFKNNYRK